MKTKFKILSLLALLIGIALTVNVVYGAPANAFYRDILHPPALSQSEDIASGDKFSVSLFTGAATYSYPLDLPLGTNGLQPSLSLSYNHESSSKPGYVGSDWALSQSYIQRNINYTRSNTTNDEFILVLNGQSHKLRYDSTDARYHTQTESFLYVKNFSGGNNSLSNYWVVKTQDGTIYRFGYNSDSEQVSNQENYTTKWSLDLVNDTYNNKIFYSYKENPNSGDVGVSYPYKISYNNDQSREIEFVSESSDRPDIWDSYEQGNEVKMSRRLKEVYVRANGSLVRKYTLNYDYLDTRSFLTNISVYGGDNSSFLYSDSFSYYLPQKGWYAVGDNWDSPYAFFFLVNGEATDNGVRLSDFNRDGYVDIMKAYKSWSDPESATIKLNNKTGWTDVSSSFPYSTTMTASYYICSHDYFQYGIDRGIRIPDLNGDGFDDMIFSPHSNPVDDTVDPSESNKAYTADGDLTWTQASSFAYPGGKGSFVTYYWDDTFCKTTYGLDKGVRFVDLNGDHRSDVINNGQPSSKWLSDGNQWISTSDWPFNEEISYNSGRRPSSSCPWQRYFDRGTRFVDVNGDGLDDAIVSRSESGGTNVNKVLINTGKNFTQIGMSSPDYLVVDDIWGSPQCDTRYGVDNGVRIVDVNGDGLADVIRANSGAIQVYLNNGTGWKLDSNWNFPTQFVNSLYEDQGLRLVDINGDGAVDIMQYKSGTVKSWLSNVTKPYYLKQITTRAGGTIQIDYKKSTDLDNKGGDGVSDLGFNIWVVANITQNNNLGGGQNVVSVVSYNYSGGLYDYNLQEFRGFNHVSEKIDNKTTTHLFHQDIAREGLEFETNSSDSQGNLYQRTLQSWNSTSVNSRYIVQLLEKSEMSYDGQSSNPQIKNTSYLHDGFGNVVKIQNKGDISTTTDDRFEYFNFLNNSDAWIVNKVRNYSLLASNNSTKIKEILYSYDNLAYGQVPTKGSLTSKEDWLNTGTNPLTQYSYDSFGNRVNETDANGHTTSYVFGIRDSTNTFADRIINARGQIVDYAYDLGTGKILSQTDSNNKITNYTYDVFGRITKEILPYDSLTYPTKQYTYEWDGIAPEKVKVSSREQNGSSSTFDVSYFYDGFGRLVQSKQDNPNSQQIVNDFYYDIIGRVTNVSNPYLTSFLDNYTSPNQTVAKSVYSYDPLDRAIKIQNPDNSVINISYSHWNTTVYDENGHRKDYQTDAYNQIISVREYNSAEIYTTNYQYNEFGSLIKIQDSNGNIFNYTLDSLGRKVRNIDPDIGTWNYTYDGVGNILRQTDNRNVTLTISYDSLNRPTSKVSTSGNVTYLYDLDKNGTLSQIQGKDSTSNYTYDDRLRKTSEKTIIDGRTFTLNLLYDSMDRVVNEVLPDGTNKIYHYNENGKISAVDGIINISYNEMGRPVSRLYANNLVSNLSYDSGNFRLNKIKTGNQQELNYSYDLAGNTKKINDVVNGRIFSMVYDDLNRLNYVTINNYSSGSDKSINFTYNRIGNMLNKTTSDGESTGYVYSSGPVHAPSRLDSFAPLSIAFVSPTPLNGSSQNSSSFSVSMTTSGADSRYAFVDTDRSLSLWLRMDDKNGGSFVDLSTYNNTVITVGSPQNTTGAFGNAISLVNLNSAGLRVSNTNAVNVSQAFTISFWFKGSDTSYNNFFVGKWDGVTPNDISWQASVSTGGVCNGTDLYVSRDGATVNRAYVRKCNQNYQDGQWHNFVGVFNPGQELSLYIDGNAGGSTIVGNINTLTGVFVNAESLYIGNRTKGNYNGSIDEVLFFKRALSSSEVNSLYSAQSNQYVNTFNLLSAGAHSIKGSAVNSLGSLAQTETRTISVTASYPTLQFVSPTPADGSTINSSQFVASLSSSDSGQHYATAEFDRDILLWMPFDDVNASGSPLDISTYGSHGSKQGDAGQSSSGKFGKSFIFDGSGDSVVVPDQSSLDINSSFSVSFWFKGSSSTAQQPLVGKWNGTSNQITWFTDLATGGICNGIDFYVSEDGATTDRVYIRDCGKTYQDGQWHLLTGVFDAGKSIKLYIDGTSVGTTSGNASTVTSVYANNQSLQIGAGYSANQYNGSIDDLLIFRRALSQSEVSALYNATSNQYSGTFLQIDDVTHTLRGYAMNTFGVRNSTSLRTLRYLPPLDLSGLSYVLINGVQKGFYFRINNTLSTNVTNVAWNLTTGLTTKASTFNVTLKGGESLAVIIAYNYTSPGTYPVVATGFSGSYMDREGITVTV